MIADERRLIHALAHDHALDGNFERLGDQHGERRLMTLSLRMRYRVHGDAPVAIHLQCNLVLGNHAGIRVFNHRRNAAAPQFARLLRCGTARRVPAPIRSFERFFQQAREVCIFVNGARGRLVWKRFGWNEITLAQFGRVDVQFVRCLAHQPLYRIGDIGPPRAAIVTDRRSIRERDAPSPVQRGYAIGSGETDNRIANSGYRSGWCRVSADICDPIESHGKELAAAIGRKLAAHHPGPAVGIREKRFGSRRNPLHWPPRGSCRHHHSAVLRVTHTAAAKSSAHVACDDFDPVLGHPGITGELHTQHVGALHACMHGVALRALLERDQTSARLHGTRHDPRAHELESGNVRRLGESRFHRGGISRFALEGHIARHVLMELRRAGGERLFRINGAWQIFVLHLYQCTRILGTVHGLGNDQRHGFADKSNSPVCKHGRVRFVGEPVALIVAESVHSAQDACALIEVQYEDLPCAVDPEEALAPSAPQLHENVPGNMSFECEAGDAGAVEAAFAEAAHVTRLKLMSTRVVPSPMEPRACLITFERRTERYTVHACVQGANMLRMQLAGYARVPEDRIEVIARDVGGGFGSRSMGYPEYCAVMMAARTTGRPVKWVSTRSEAFLSDTHGRSSVMSGELALDRGGKFLAMRFDWVADVGAYTTPPGAIATIRNPIICLTGAYRIPALYGRWRVSFTNAAPIGNYRGAGRPDIAYAIERLVSQAAAELDVDAAELRKRNFIPPEAFPYKTPTGSTYENADFPGLLEKALKASDWSGYPARRAASEQAGKLRGRGISTVIENTNAGMVAKDQIALEVDSDGRVTVHSVAHSQGQGHETTLAMLVAKALEIRVERVIVRQGVDEPPLVGNHTGGSRNTVGPGSICYVTALKLIEHAKSLVAEQLGVEPSQVDYASGKFHCSEPEKTLTLAEVANKKNISIVGEGSFGSTFPNDCHIAEVEIDPDTGLTTIVSYVAILSLIHISEPTR